MIGMPLVPNTCAGPAWQPSNDGWCHLIMVGAFLGSAQIPRAHDLHSSQLAWGWEWGRMERWWQRQLVDLVTSIGPTSGAQHSTAPHLPYVQICALVGVSLWFVFWRWMEVGFWVSFSSVCISAWKKCIFSQLFTVLLWNLHSHPSAELSNSLLHLPTVSTLLRPFNQGTWLLSGRHMP